MQEERVMVRLPEREIEGKRLGRHIDHDSRSRSFPASRAAAVRSVRHANSNLPLNQEAHTCSTAHALCAALNSEPARGSQPALTETSAVKIYELARSLEKPRAAASYGGSSALMACKAAQRMGFIDSYHHAFGIEHALEALSLRPVMSGFSWHESFDQPDEAGKVEIGAGAMVRGGHEVLADEIDLEQELVWFWNSWGPEFGVGGRFCMSFDTWERLLKEHGDVTVPVVG